MGYSDMKRVLLYGLDALDLEKQYSDEEELISKIHKSSHSYMYIDTTKNLFCANINNYRHKIFDLEDVDLINNIEFIHMVWLVMTSSTDNHYFTATNFKTDDLRDYFSSIATNEKTRELIFRIIISRDIITLKTKNVLDIFLNVLSEKDNIVYKKYYMELKLLKGGI